MSGPHFGHRSKSSRSLKASAAETWLLRAFDTTLVLLLFAAPLVMGGRHPAGRLVFVVLGFLAAAFWCGKQALGRANIWRGSAMQWIIGAAVLLVVVQLVPLPESVHGFLSPYTAEVLPLWTSGSDSAVQLGTWNTLSLAPYETRIGLLVLLAYAAIFLAACQRIRTADDVQRTFRWIAIAGCVMAAIGMAQYLFGNGKFLWTYMHPFRDAMNGAKGPFANRNHFAQFLAVCLGPLLYLVYYEMSRHRKATSKQASFANSEAMRERWQLYATGGMLLFTLFAAFLSYSRGGVLAVACVLSACFVLAIWKKLLDRRALMVIGGTGAVLLVALGIHGMGRLTNRIESLSSLPDDNSAQMRLLIWDANWQAVQKFPLVGMGAGAHTEVYPLFLDADTRVEFTHTENGYLQVLSENGIVGLVLLLSAIGIAGYWAFRAIRTADDKPQAALAVAAIGSLAAPLVHGAADFVWWIPACLTPTLLLLACLRQLAHADDAEPNRSRSSERLPAVNWQWAGACLASSGLVLIAVVQLTGPARANSAWDNYLAISLATKQFRADAKQHGQTAALGKLDPESPETVKQMADHLQTALAYDPDNPRINARLAAIRLRQFGLAQEASDNPMGLAMIRDAALASKFSSRRQQYDWLNTALGENVSLLNDALTCSRRAVAGSPLQGEVYTHLAELSFLQSPRPERKAALIEQALLARPHSGNVLLAAGREAAIAGEHARAIDLLRQAFHAERESQKLVIELIATKTSIEEFVEVFDPDLEALRTLRDHYQEAGIEPAVMAANESVVAAASARAEQLEGPQAAALWLEASRLQIVLNRPSDAAKSARLAVDAAPLDFDSRVHLANCLMGIGRYEDAQKQYKWCLTRQPSDDRIRRQLAAARRLELASGGGEVSR